MKNVSIMGAGYVGLPTTAHWATQHKVSIYEPDENKVEQVNNCIYNGGELYIHEKGLLESLRKHKDNITVSSNIEDALEDPDFIFIAAGTPPNEEGRANLKYVVSAADLIGKYIERDTIVLNKSTVPPGTAYLVSKHIDACLAERKESYKVDVGSCPEFLAEGTAMENLRVPDRIVYGCDNPEALEKIAEFFSYLHDKSKFVPMGTLSAELTKYASNSMLAARVSFMNELALFADKIGADIKEVSRGMGRDSRIGSKFLKAGFGFGGSCFGKDVSAINEYAKLLDVNLGIINSTLEANTNVVNSFYNKIKDHYEILEGRKFAVWGVGFKANTDDLRDSRSVEVIKNLREEGAEVFAYDTIKPALKNLDSMNLGVHLMENQYDVEGIDGLIIGNEAEEFRSPDPEMKLRQKVIFDGKNVVVRPALEELRKKGFIYKSCGVDCRAKEVDKKKLAEFLEEKYISR